MPALAATAASSPAEARNPPVDFLSAPQPPGGYPMARLQYERRFMISRRSFSHATPCAGRLHGAAHGQQTLS
jgi:hypothetical protein